eukprot:Nitzschia sp. Nitz4//scaffold269_size25945//21831//23369//NITZ4_008293-RA/size25945-processed-gene-0.16-mRNA-1//-1//CDS//3329544979//8305//frame0
MDDASVAGSVASMKKWGIPHKQAPEITLLERLVWVKYKSYWWPALLYHSYSELQQHLYDQLDMVLKAQFAMAIMRHAQDKVKIKVARLLGRSMLEVVEVEEDNFCEFYWQLPNVLPTACSLDHYGDDLELFFDFHRALDQVEDVIREVSEENFALWPNSEQKTWLERAEATAEKQGGRVRSSSVDSKGNFSASDVSVWSSKKHGDNESLHRTGIETRLNSKTKPNEKQYKSRNGIVSDISVCSSKHSHSSKIDMEVVPSPSHLTRASSRSSKKSLSGKSRRSTKSKVSQANTEVVDNRSSSRYSKGGHGGFPVTNENGVLDEEEARDTITVSSRSIPGSDAPKTRPQSHSPQQEPTTRRQTPVGHVDFAPTVSVGNPAEKNKSQKVTETALVNKRLSPIQLLPGLEGDDIIPGLSAQVEGARSTWMGVLGFMNESREDPNLTENSPKDESLREGVRSTLPHIQEESTPTDARKELVSALASGATPQEQAGQIIQETKTNLGFWHRFTCGVGS